MELSSKYFLHSELLFSLLILGAFTKSRKTAIKFVMSVCPSILMERLDSHCKNFHEISYLIIFQKSVEKTQFSLKYNKNNGTLNENLYFL
jgi:hypothetical protein